LRRPATPRMSIRMVASARMVISGNGVKQLDAGAPLPRLRRLPSNGQNQQEEEVVSHSSFRLSHSSATTPRPPPERKIRRPTLRQVTPTATEEEDDRMSHSSMLSHSSATAPRPRSEQKVRRPVLRRVAHTATELEDEVVSHSSLRLSHSSMTTPRPPSEPKIRRPALRLVTHTATEEEDDRMSHSSMRLSHSSVTTLGRPSEPKIRRPALRRVAHIATEEEDDVSNAGPDGGDMSVTPSEAESRPSLRSMPSRREPGASAEPKKVNLLLEPGSAQRPTTSQAGERASRRLNSFKTEAGANRAGSATKEVEAAGRLALEVVFQVADRRECNVVWTRGNAPVLGAEGSALDLHSRELREKKARLLVVHPQGPGRRTEEVVQELRASFGQALPIFVVVLEAPRDSGHDPYESTVGLHSSALAAGADDLIWNARSSDELGAAIDMSLAMRRMRLAELRQLRKQLTVEHQEMAQDMVRRAQEEERSKAIVWEVVHRICPDFPPADMDLEARPRTGARVGTCTLGIKIGEGAYGKVYKSDNHSTQRQEAMKVIAKGSVSEGWHLSSLWKEMSLHKLLEHEHIVQFYGVMHGPRHIFIRLEDAGALNLFTLLQNRCTQRLDLVEASAIQGQLASAVAHCHARGVAHRDLKAENIAVVEGDEYQIKVLDFGQSVRVDEPRTDIAGTFPNMAPEVFVAGRRTPYAPAGIDVWASGVILMEMTCGLDHLDVIMDWSEETEVSPARRDELEAYFSDDARFEAMLRESLGEVPTILLELLRGMLQVNPQARWGSDRVRRCSWLRTT